MRLWKYKKNYGIMEEELKDFYHSLKLKLDNF